MLKGRLVELIRDMDVRPLGKDPKLTDLAEWVIYELPKVAPHDPRTRDAVEIAKVWWEHERSSK
jgi:hypothetical protein